MLCYTESIKLGSLFSGNATGRQHSRKRLRLRVGTPAFFVHNASLISSSVTLLLALLLPLYTSLANRSALLPATLLIRIETATTLSLSHASILALISTLTAYLGRLRFVTWNPSHNQILVFGKKDVYPLWF